MRHFFPPPFDCTPSEWESFCSTLNLLIDLNAVWLVSIAFVLCARNSSGDQLGPIRSSSTIWGFPNGKRLFFLFENKSVDFAAMDWSFSTWIDSLFFNRLPLHRSLIDSNKPFSGNQFLGAASGREMKWSAITKRENR